MVRSVVGLQVDRGSLRSSAGGVPAPTTNSFIYSASVKRNRGDLPFLRRNSIDALVGPGIVCDPEDRIVGDPEDREDPTGRSEEGPAPASEFHWGRARGGRLRGDHADRRPELGRAVRRGARLGSRRRRSRRRRGGGGVRGVEAVHPVGSQPRPHPDRRRPVGSVRGAGEGRMREHRQAARPHHVRGDPPDDRPDPVLRGSGAPARRPVGGRVPGRPYVLRPARARRGVRRGDPVELPDDDGRVEVGPGHRRGQHRGAEAVGNHAGEHPPHGRGPRRAPAARRLQRGVRRPRHRAGPRWEPHVRHGLHHRQRPGRDGGGGRGFGGPQAGPSRARREGAGDRLRRRGRQRHRGGDRRRRLFQRRAGLHRGDPRVGRARRACRSPRRPGRAGPWHDRRRDRRRRRRLRPAEQRRPARAGPRVRRASAGPRQGPDRRRARRGAWLLFRARRWSPACNRTTR